MSSDSNATGLEDAPNQGDPATVALIHELQEYKARATFNSPEWFAAGNLIRSLATTDETIDPKNIPILLDGELLEILQKHQENTGILNRLLAETLSIYADMRGAEGELPSKSMRQIGFHMHEKIAAAKALIKCIMSPDEELDPAHVPALLDGELNSIIQDERFGFSDTKVIELRHRAIKPDAQDPDWCKKMDDLGEALLQYQSKRTIESRKEYSNILGQASIFGGGHSKTDKFSAVKKIIACINDSSKTLDLEPQEKKAIEQGTLGRLLKDNNHQEMMKLFQDRRKDTPTYDA
jgi:hypothetical protein